MIGFILNRIRLSTKVSMISILFLFCSSTISAQQTINGTIMHDGLQREYILYVPANYTGDMSVPLVFNFHGYGSNSIEQLNYGDFRPLAEQHGFLIVHPQGTIDSNNSTHFNVGWQTSTVDDVGFTEALIDELSSSYNIESKKIYSTGMSNGGFMSYKLACELSDRIAAIASVTGTMTVGQQNNCNTSHPVPIMEIHGTDDATVPYDGNFGFDSTTDVLSFWVTKNNCDTTSVITNIEDTNMTDSSTVEYQVYENGDKGVSVEHFKILGGGHTWPGSNFEIGPVTNKDINASEEIWKFFSKYDIDGEIETLSVNGFEKNQNLTIYPNPVNSYLKINHDYSEKIDYKLVSVHGKLLTAGSFISNNHEIDMTKFSPGIYFLIAKNSSYKILKNK